MGATTTGRAATVPLAGLLALLAPAAVQEAPAPAAVLAERLVAVPSIRYRAQAARTLRIELLRWEVEGEVRIRRAGRAGDARIRVEAEVRAPGASTGARVALQAEGERWRFLHRDEGWATEGDGPHVGGAWSEAAAALVLEELALGALGWDGARSGGPGAAEGLADLGPTRFAGTPCRVLELRRGESWTRWTVGQDDAVPRLRERELPVGAVETAVERLQVLVAEPGVALAEADLALELPEGCERRAARAAPEVPAEVAAPAPLGDSTEPLRRAFAAAHGRVRLVGLFAPT